MTNKGRSFLLINDLVPITFFNEKEPSILEYIFHNVPRWHFPKCSQIYLLSFLPFMIFNTVLNIPPVFYLPPIKATGMYGVAI